MLFLQRLLGYEFIDTDLVIQHREKRLLREIIADEGNEGFLAIENEVNATLEANESVIAPGGSAIYGKEAMEHFKEIGTIVYLKLSYEDLAKASWKPEGTRRRAERGPDAEGSLR